MNDVVLSEPEMQMYFLSNVMLKQQKIDLDIENIS